MIKPAGEDFDFDPFEGLEDCIGLEEELEDIFDDSLADVKLSNIATTTEAFFTPDGPLSHAEEFGGRPYEFRPQQAEMALRTAEALRDNHNLCVEAPTGVGKSFAYLVPIIHYAKQQANPVVISTETINLQEQLIEKDIPLLQKIMQTEIKACLAKGRNNYLCRRRLALATGDRKDEFLPLNSLLPEVERISLWAETTTDGSRSAIDFKVEPGTWSCVCCEGGNCAGSKCEFFRKCFYWRARMQWEQADVIVANHALFFTDLKMKQEEDLESTLLPKYSAVVIDEAHTLEDNAAEYLGLRINSAATFNFLNRLFNPESGRGLLLKSGTEALALRTMISEIKDQAGMFFRMYEEFLMEQDDSIRRIRQAGIAPDMLSSPMNKLGHELRDYIKSLDNDDLKTELEAQPGRCDGIADSICHFVNMNCPEHVYWVEEERNSITLNAAPLNVNLMLNALLFTKQFPVILTSATLTVRHRLDYYRNRVGFSHGAELVLDSPFKPDQVRLYLPKNMPEPNHADYHDALSEHIKKMVSLTQGKAFVLFTSYRTLRYCADELEDFFDNNDINLLIQGESLNRTTLLREFKEDITSVLFGTDSFWTGVDVPGESLSNVIITKLPFAVPTHPLIQARSEQIEESGKSSFMEYSLPEAVLKFRQGIGRLIRSRSDRGIIAILDRRAVSKRYGQFFLDSIPNYPVRYID